MKRAKICLVVFVLAAGCDGHTSLSGEVVGPDDKPIAGVKVRMAEPNQPTRKTESTTDESGHFRSA